MTAQTWKEFADKEYLKLVMKGVKTLEEEHKKYTKKHPKPLQENDVLRLITKLDLANNIRQELTEKFEKALNLYQTPRSRDNRATQTLANNEMSEGFQFRPLPSTDPRNNIPTVPNRARITKDILHQWKEKVKAEKQLRNENKLKAAPKQRPVATPRHQKKKRPSPFD